MEPRSLSDDIKPTQSLILALFLLSLTWANTASATGSIGASYMRDDEQAESYLFSLNSDLPAKFRASAVLRQSTSGTGSGGNQSDGFDIKLSSDTAKPYAFSLSYSELEDDADYRSNSWQLMALWNPEVSKNPLFNSIAYWQFYAGASHQSNHFDITGPLKRIRLTREITGKGWTLGLYLQSFSGWFTDIGYNQYHYDKAVDKTNIAARLKNRLRPRPRQQRITYLILDALSNTNTLLEDSSFITIGKQWSKTSLSLRFMRQKTYLTQQKQGDIGVDVQYFLHTDWALSTGIIHNLKGDLSDSAYLGVNFFW